MRFSLRLPTDRVDAREEFLTAEAVAEMARAVEAAGFDACSVTDHPFPGTRWLADGGHHALDPWVALSFAAAATRTLRLQTHVAVLGYRNPFLAAKAVASLDVLSGGRTIFGVAAGYQRREFRALGGDFEHRNDVADETIRAIRRAWSGEDIELIGRHFAATGNSMLPRPVQRPHPPIWVGGNSRRAIRRAVELGDGWIPFPTRGIDPARVRTARLETLDDLDRRLAYLRTCSRELGRERPLEIAFVPFGLSMRDAPGDPAAFAETIDALGSRGVTWLCLSLPAESRQEYCERAARWGEELLKPLRY